MSEAEKQVPEKPKKTKGLSLPLIIGIGAGSLILVVVIVIFAIKLLFPSPEAEASGSKTASEAVNDAEMHKVKMNKNEIYEDPLLHDEDGHYKYLETGRITTNPKNSTEFVVVDLGIEFTVNEDLPEEMVKEDSKLMRKLGAIIKSSVTAEIGTRSLEELHAARPELSEIIKEKLKIEFTKRKMILKDVILKEFIIQS